MMENGSLDGLAGIAFMDILNRLFEEHFHWPVKRIQPLQGELGGSGRKIIRLSNERSSAIGILYGVREENAAFLEFSRHFRKHGLPVPEIYGEDLSHGAYLEEDLGDTTLYDFLSAHRSGDTIAPEAVEAFRKVVTILPRFQVEAARDLNYKGNSLQLHFTVEDDGVFTTPWAATVTYRRPLSVFGQWPENACAQNAAGYDRGERAAVPTANRPDF